MNASGADNSIAGRIRERLGGPAYERLFLAVRGHLEKAGIDRARSVTLPDLRDDERHALADLLGTKTLPRKRVSLSIAALDQALRQSNLGVGVVEVVEVLSGPLGNRRAERQKARAAQEALWARSAEHAALREQPALRRWLDELRASGLLGLSARRAAMDSAVFLDLALKIVARLPENNVLLTVLAAEETGNAHALDQGQPLATLVLRAAACLVGWPKVPQDAIGRRLLWAKVGVNCDPLSATVLVLGMRPVGGHRLARHLCESADAGEPRCITLRELTGVSLRLADSADVFVCENPDVMTAAAERLHAYAAPLVCIGGFPSSAALALLHQLRCHGTRLRFHTDFDWSGVRIGNLLAEKLGAVPWRLGAADYEAAIAKVKEVIPLNGQPTEASWDPMLHEAMVQAGHAVSEEQVLDTLLRDLERQGQLCCQRMPLTLFPFSPLGRVVANQNLAIE